MNNYYTIQNTVYIQLQNGHEAIVDLNDLELVKQFHWYAHKSGNTHYVRTKKNGRHTLHRLLMQPLKNEVVDHINGNGLDNRRANPRNVSSQQNSFNTRKQSGTSSRFKGLYFEKNKGKWKAQIGHNYKRFHLGYFDNEFEAALAYDKRALELFGPYARLNFPGNNTMAA